MKSDRELLLEWRRGDERAGNQLLRRHYARICRFFRTKVEHEAMVDLIQRTFLGCVLARERVPDDASFEVYLLGIARRQLIQHYRRSATRRRVLMPLAEEPAARHFSPSWVVARREEQQLLLEALRSIPLELQIAVELFYWDHMCLERIARVTEVPLGTVKSRLHRARRELRRRFDALCDADGTRCAQPRVVPIVPGSQGLAQACPTRARPA